MIRKRIIQLATALSFLIAGIQPALAGAVSSHGQPALPETAGVYSVPGHSKLKLRVFVHNARSSHGSHHGGGPSVPNLTCGLTDPDSSTADGVTGWKLPAGTWTYRLNTGSAPSLIGAGGMASAAANAFSAWSNTSVGSSVSFVRGANTGTSRASLDGQNIISWGRTSGSALAVTYTWYNTSTGVVSEEDTIFNSKFSWEWTDQSVHSGCAYQGYYDAQDILTHELGHWMGLDDNYDASFTDNTMYGYGSPTEFKKDTLATGDISAVNTLY